MIDAKNQATFCKLIPYGPANPATFDLLTAEEKARLPNSPQNRVTASHRMPHTGPQTAPP